METTKSADGTGIAYDRSGDGPPLVIVLGAFCDRKSFVPPAGLTSRFTVCTYDRRGRGDSGDTPPYSPDLEVADLAAVIEAVSGAGAGWPGRAGPGPGPGPGRSSSGIRREPRWRCAPRRTACRWPRSWPTRRRT